MSDSKIQKLCDWFIREFDPGESQKVEIYRSKHTYYDYWVFCGVPHNSPTLYICRPKNVDTVIKKTRADFKQSFREQQKNPLHPPNTYYLD